MLNISAYESAIESVIERHYTKCKYHMSIRSKSETKDKKTKQKNHEKQEQSEIFAKV